MVGGPSSRVQLVITLSRSAGDQLAPAPTVVRLPKLDSWSSSALALSVKLPSALNSRPRREIGRSRLTEATPVVRPTEPDVSTPSRRLSLSRPTELAPTLKVALALPAGSLNKLPLAVALRSPDMVVSRARSRGNKGLSRSVPVTLRSQSALPVTL